MPSGYRGRRDAIKTLLAALAVPFLPHGQSYAAVAGLSRRFDVVVIGGGMAGLAAAHSLRSRDPVLLEAESRPGGRVLAAEHDGQEFEAGADRAWPVTGSMAELGRALGLEALEVPPHAETVWRGGKAVSGIGRQLKLLAQGGGVETFNRFLSALQQVGDYYDPPFDHDPRGRLAHLDAMTAGGWFRELGLPSIYRDVLGAHARSLLGAPLDEVSALAFAACLFPRLSDLDEISGPEDLDEPGAVTGYGAFSFKGGLSALPRALGQALGPGLIDRARVLRVEGNDAQGYRIICLIGGRETVIASRAVIVATPAPTALEIAAPALEPEQIEIMKRIAYAPHLAVAIFTRQPLLEAGHTLNLPEGWLISGVRAATRRDGDPVTIAVLQPLSPGDGEIVQRPDEWIRDRLRVEIDRILPRSWEKVSGIRVFRHPFGRPVMEPGSHARLVALHDSLWGGFQLAGDWTIGPDLESAVLSGVMAAAHVERFL